MPYLFPILSLSLFIILSLPLSLSTPLSPSTNITLSGDAHFANTTISLTPQFNCRSPPSSSPQSLGFGRAFFVSPVQFLDSITNKTASFSTQFSFSITNPYAPFCPFGEGFAFLITSKTDSFSYGSMGVPNGEGEDFTYVAVEFDTMLDLSVGDVNGNHVGIDVGSVVSVASVDGFSKGIDLKAGRLLTAWIEYRSGEDMIKVWVGYSQIKPPSPLLIAQIDLSKHFKEFMHVGFSASNGRGSAIHLVGGWKFKTYGLLPSVMPMETVAEEGDCFMCSSPEDLGGQNSNANYHHISKRLEELALGLGGLAAFIISLSAIVVIVIWCMTRKKRSLISNEGHRYQGNKLPKRLSLSAIKSATKGFNHNRIIGEGGSATVYEGSLPSCGAVAVKRFSQVSQIGMFRNQFSTEFATMMGCLRHKNLIQLQGWCCEEDELVLVYQYMPNGSLDKILHKNKNPLSLLLTWDRRVKIVLGIASALVYLHEECDKQIIHRDVKTCNIMLDDDLNAKLGDFGLAEVYEHSCRTRDATIPAGTMGYLAPEYVYLGVPTVKTDVYSFGVVVLEVASGKRPVNEEGTLLVDNMWELWGKGKLIEAADLKLRGKYNKLEMERMLMVGLCCVHPDQEKRPTVREAATMITGEAPLPVLPSRKPSVSIGSGFPGGFAEFMNLCGNENLDFDGTPWLTPESHF